MMENNDIKLLIADDHELLRDGLKEHFKRTQKHEQTHQHGRWRKYPVCEGGFFRPGKHDLSAGTVHHIRRFERHERLTHSIHHKG